MNFQYRYSVVGVRANGTATALVNRNSIAEVTAAAEDFVTRSNSFEKFQTFYIMDREDASLVIGQGKLPSIMRPIVWDK